MFISEIQTAIRSNQRKISLLLVFVLFSLVYSAFAGVSMMAMHVDSGINDATAQHHMHTEGHTSTQDMPGNHCNGVCDQDQVDMDCSASHCTPVGILALDVFVLSPPAHAYSDQLQFQYDSVFNFPPYTPPINPHV